MPRYGNEKLFIETKNAIKNAKQRRKYLKHDLMHKKQRNFGKKFK